MPSRSLDVTFPPLTASVSGRLTDENGAPKSGVWIGVEYLDAQHRSILAGPGTYQVEVTAMGCMKTSVQVSAVSDVSGLLVSMNRESVP